jgi:2',3'-cyclic-nucleotide 2'-phosphodiesterase (5'-nucleotidase family)
VEVAMLMSYGVRYTNEESRSYGWGTEKWIRLLKKVLKTAVDAQGKEIPVRIGVLGFSLDYELSVNKTVFKDCGFEIREDFDLLNTLARKLKKTEDCDAVILLSHSDVNDILPHLDSESNVDLILGGHMHVSDFGIAENGISYIQPIGNCEGMGYTELIFGTDASGKAVFLKTTEPTVVICPETEMVSEDGNENIELLDPELKRISDAALDSLQAVMGREIGRISVDVLNDDYLEGSGNRSSTGGRLMRMLLFSIRMGSGVNSASRKEKQRCRLRSAIYRRCSPSIISFAVLN